MKDSSEWIQMESILGSDQHIPAYGGFQMPVEALERAASSLNAGTVPMLASHDQTKPLRTRRHDARVEKREDGVTVLRLRYQIHPEDVHLVAGMGAMSMALQAPLESRAASFEPPSPLVGFLAGDHAWFTDEVLEAAETQLRSQASIEARRVYQFELVPDPQIYLELAWNVFSILASGVAGNALYDALKTLFRRRKVPDGSDASVPTKVNLVVKDGDRELKATVETGDEEVALEAARALGKVADGFFELPPPRAAASPTSLAAVNDQVAQPKSALLLWDKTSRTWAPRDP
ncbi:hypothetical protein [Solicola sp. PLA-1-18]|uniref:hypothetical protein n=1 Tax=Solicola sp. PLA-1-18 TaxID=3380532 RepID=UPI003B807F0D